MTWWILQWAQCKDAYNLSHCKNNTNLHRRPIFNGYFLLLRQLSISPLLLTTDMYTHSTILILCCSTIIVIGSKLIIRLHQLGQRCWISALKWGIFEVCMYVCIFDLVVFRFFWQLHLLLFNIFCNLYIMSIILYQKCDNFFIGTNSALFHTDIKCLPPFKNMVFLQ